MKEFVLQLYHGFTKTKLAILLGVVAVYVALMLQSGGCAAELMLFALVILGYIVLPGIFWTALLRTKKFAPTLAAPLVLLLGSGFFAVVYCCSMYLHLQWIVHFLPPIVGIAGLAYIMYKNREGLVGKVAGRVRLPKPHHWMLILLYAALLLFFTFYGVVKNARPLAVGDILANQDLLWNVGNANSFKLAFPPQDIRFVGVRLHYHYLTELLTGALSLVSGVSAYNIIAFYMQPFMLAALVTSLYSLGRILWSDGFLKPVLFAYTPFLFGCASLWKILPNGWSVFLNSNVTHLITNVNSQTTALTFLSIFISVLVLAMRQKYKIGILHFACIVGAFVLLTFSKGPIAAIVVCSLVVTLLVGILQKNVGWQGLLMGAVLAGLFVFIYATMFSSGANDSMPISFAGTLTRGYFNNIQNLLWHKNYYVWLVTVPLLWVFQSFLTMPAQFCLYLRALFRDVRHFNKLPQEKLLAHGAMAGGIFAFFLFNHPHMSQLYFLFAGMYFVNVLAVDAIGTLNWPKPGQAGKVRGVAKKSFVLLVAVCVAIGMLTNGFLYVHYMGSGGRQLMRNLGITEKYPYDVVVTPDDEAAMLWLRDNSPQGALFATNRIHTGINAEGISNLYSAYCERQGFMEGFQYAKTNMGVAEETINHRLQVNNALFFAETLPEQILALCRENGISYLIYSTQLPGDESQLAFLACVYTSPTVRIYQVAEV